MHRQLPTSWMMLGEFRAIALSLGRVRRRTERRTVARGSARRGGIVRLARRALGIDRASRLHERSTLHAQDDVLVRVHRRHQSVTSHSCTSRRTRHRARSHRFDSVVVSRRASSPVSRRASSHLSPASAHRVVARAGPGECPREATPARLARLRAPARRLARPITRRTSARMALMLVLRRRVR